MQDQQNMQRCPTCGTLNPATSRFCIECSTRLIPSGAQPAQSQPEEYEPTLVITPSSSEPDLPPYSPPLQQPRSGSKKWVWILAGAGVVLILLLCTGVIVGYQGWKYYQTAQEEQEQTATARTHMTVEAERAAMAMAETTTARANVTMEAEEAAKAETSTARASISPSPTVGAGSSAAGGTGTEATPATPDEQTAAPEATAMAVLQTIEAEAPEPQTIYGPEDVRLVHEKGFFITEAPDEISVRNFGAQAIFHNPYPLSMGGWDYGFLFPANDSEIYYLIVDSDADWSLRIRSRDGSESDLVAQGSIEQFDTSASGSNELFLMAYDDKAFFMVNDEFVSMIDIPQHTHSGPVGVLTAFYKDHDISGEVTRAEDFQIASFGPAGVGEMSATAWKQRGFLAFGDDFTDNRNGWHVGDMPDRTITIKNGVYSMFFKEQRIGGYELWETLTLQNLVAEVDIAPLEQSAYGGIIFSYQDEENYYIVRVSSDGDFMVGKVFGGDSEMLLPWEKHPAINEGVEINNVMVVRNGGTILVYVNGVEVGEANDSSLARGKVGLVAGSGNAEQAEVLLDNFRVWRLP
jgi:hypothetical protein